MSRLAAAALVAVLATTVIAAFPSACLATEEVVTIPTRDGVTVSYLLVQDASANAKPTVVVVSFVGSGGAIGLKRRAESGSVKFGPGANFLIRVRAQFADGELVDAIVDSPSDAPPDGMSDTFRLGSNHATDIRLVLRDLKTRFPNAKIFLVGTSRGTVSAAALGVSLADMIQGVVLSSTVSYPDRMGPGLSSFDFSTIKVPVLLVHHRDDRCRPSPYTGVERLAKQFPLVSVSGGDPPQTDSCEPLSPHGYFGREIPTAQAIKDWMLGRPFARDVN